MYNNDQGVAYTTYHAATLSAATVFTISSTKKQRDLVSVHSVIVCGGGFVVLKCLTVHVFSSSYCNHRFPIHHLKRENVEFKILENKK